MCRAFRLFLFVLLFAGLSCAPYRDPTAQNKQVPEKKDDDEAPTKIATVPVAANSVQDRVKQALTIVHDRPVNIDHNFWTVFHAILGMGFDTQLTNLKTKDKVRAIDYVRQQGEEV